MTQQEWMPIAGFGGNYTVWRDGQVISLSYKQTGKCKALTYSFCKKTGYYRVQLTYRCKSKTIAVHRLLATAFIPNPYNKKCVNHINGDKTDNRIENLEWATHGENEQHAYDT